MQISDFSSENSAQKASRDVFRAELDDRQPAGLQIERGEMPNLAKLMAFATQVMLRQSIAQRETEKNNYLSTLQSHANESKRAAFSNVLKLNKQSDKE